MLGSSYNKKKAEENNNQQLFLDPSEKWSPRQTLGPQIGQTGRGVEPQLTGSKSWRQRLSSGTSNCSNTLDCNWWTAWGSVWTDFTVTPHWGIQAFFELYTQKPWFSQWRLSRRRGNTFWKYIQSSPQPGLPSKEIIWSECNGLGFHQILTHLRKRKCPTQVHWMTT